MGQVYKSAQGQLGIEKPSQLSAEPDSRWEKLHALTSLII